ncbi:hypothetical protein [Parendozoicomonas haliclonae]|uniref:Uncharacterized protein n=1 Tax=Parendozoicomonas haliclonae TaxID=1960125 RepID=A0A1X7AQR6_9GAMM|nr:hypothetical protein [Parendozoicomonas haliclonae]SMA50654.1 hypothetical protein EHSB41UT_04471 [Parendozoicomonas haliclonae]
MSSLVERHENLGWCSFNDEPMHCYKLSHLQITFYGALTEPSYLIAPRHIPHKASLYERSYYYDWNNNYPYKLYDGYPLDHHMEMPDVSWSHFVPDGAHVSIVGGARVNISPSWININHLSDISDLRDPEQLALFRLRAAADGAKVYNDKEGALYPKCRDDLVVHHLKNRLWYEEIAGHISVSPNYRFTTALTEEHILTVTFHPTGHWEQGTLPSPELREKVFRSFWAFMDGLSIIEDPALQTVEPGVHGYNSCIDGEAVEDSGWLGEVSDDSAW